MAVQLSFVIQLRTEAFMKSRDVDEHYTGTDELLSLFLVIRYAIAMEIQADPRNP
jgi:hypothetical protein